MSEIQHRLGSSRLSLCQIAIIVTCFMVNFVDGYDVIAIALAAPSISQDWDIAPQVLGYILSAELVGMTVGAIVLSALCDKYGRRRILVPSVFIVALSTLLTAYTQTVPQLIVCRLITGLGVAGVLTSAATLASEISPPRMRPAVVTFVTMGFSVGSLLASVIATHSLAHYGWESLFLMGATMGAIIFLLCFFVLPESIEFQASQAAAPEKSLPKINRTLVRLGLEPLRELSFPERSTSAGSLGFAELLGSEFIRLTLLFWGVFFALFWANYGAGKWFPKLLVADGFALAEAIRAITFWVLGGICGTLLSSFSSLKFRITRIVAVLLLYSGILIVLFSIVQPDTTSSLYAFMFLLGLGISASMTAMYSIPVANYPVRLRALGLGCCIGVGRIGAIVAPVVTGYLVAAGADTVGVLLVVVLPVVILALIGIRFADFAIR